MTKKDKLFLLIFILSCLSIAIAIPLKLLGLNIFGIDMRFISVPVNIENIISAVMLLIEFYLIVGCITLYEPKKLAIKILPYLPLNILLTFFPNNTYLLLCILIIFVTCISLRPAFSTIIWLIFNLVLIFTIQLTLVWLKLNIITFLPTFLNFINLSLLHIDEFIILGFLYFVNRKWGEKIVSKLVFPRRNKR